MQHNNMIFKSAFYILPTSCYCPTAFNDIPEYDHFIGCLLLHPLYFIYRLPYPILLSFFHRYPRIFNLPTASLLIQQLSFILFLCTFHGHINQNSPTFSSHPVRYVSFNLMVKKCTIGRSEVNGRV